MARPQLPSLPKPRGVFWLLAAFALALLLEGRRASAAPLQANEGAPPMAKIYPRGSHWAVGHFMGKKSTGDFPYMSEEQNKAPFSLLLDDVKRLEEDPHWEETVKKLLRLLEANDSRSAQVFREELPFSAKNTWEVEDNSSLKDEQEEADVANFLMVSGDIPESQLASQQQRLVPLEKMDALEATNGWWRVTDKNIYEGSGGKGKERILKPVHINPRDFCPPMANCCACSNDGLSAANDGEERKFSELKQPFSTPKA